MGEVPADWALKLAVERMGFTMTHYNESWLHYSIQSVCARTLARYIEGHEEKPVDPLVLAAREVCAVYYEGRGADEIAQKYRDGYYDSSDLPYSIALLGIKRGIEIGKNGGVE